MAHPSITQALEELDAGVFSGDTFYDDEDRAHFRSMMARWERGLVEIDECKQEMAEEK